MKAIDLVESLMIFAKKDPQCVVDLWSRMQVSIGPEMIVGDDAKRLIELGWDRSYQGEEFGGYMYERDPDEVE